ncbi:hypothetical protein GCM10009839_48910 [Catenulispora yoronensis]|uniref:Uncharacterized protein n=1 Tax=Catenulispora yoronensis TaxID=450799 RepID=A0ABP5G7U6_9ACTN
MDLCGSFTPADLTKAVGETFVACKQTVTTDAVDPTHVTTVAVYSESDHLRILTVSYATNAAHALQTYHAETKVPGLGDAAWFGDLAFDLQVAYGQNVVTTRVGLRGMGGSDVLAVDKKVINAVVGKLGLGG